MLKFLHVNSLCMARFLGSWPTVLVFSIIEKERLMVKFVLLCLHGQHLWTKFESHHAL